MGLFDFLKDKQEVAEPATPEVEEPKAAAAQDDYSGMSIKEIANSLNNDGEGNVQERLMAILEKLSDTNKPVQSQPETFSWNNDNHEAILADPDKLKHAVQTVVADAMIEKISRLFEQREAELMQKVSGMINGSKSVDLFYNQHKDLEPFKEFVDFVAQNLRAANPKMAPAKFNAMVAKVARQKLNLTEETTPALPQGTKSARLVEKTQDDTADVMAEFFGKRSAK